MDRASRPAPLMLDGRSDLKLDRWVKAAPLQRISTLKGLRLLVLINIHKNPLGITSNILVIFGHNKRVRKKEARLVTACCLIEPGQRIMGCLRDSFLLYPDHYCLTYISGSQARP